MTMPSPKKLLQLSLCAAVITIALKLGAWYVTGSVGFLSDGMESFVNLAGAGFALWMIAIAKLPADANHPHGHSKAEYFSSAVEGSLIFCAALAIFWTAFQRLFNPQPLVKVDWGLALILLAALINAGVSWLLLKAAKVHQSIALEADGKHLLTDVYTSLGVIAGVGLVKVTGLIWLDPLIAILAAMNILYDGYKLIDKSSQGLMDHAAPAEVNQVIRNTLHSFEKRCAQGAQPILFDHVVTRTAGQQHFLSMHMHMPPDYTLREAAQLRNQVEQALIQAVPELYVAAEILPSNLEPMKPLINTPLYGTTAPSGADTADDTAGSVEADKTDAAVKTDDA